MLGEVETGTKLREVNYDSQPLGKNHSVYLALRHVRFCNIFFEQLH